MEFLRSTNPQQSHGPTIPVYEGLLDARDIELNPVAVLQTQIEALQKTQTEPYEFALRQQEQLIPSPNDVDNLRCAVAIPVASHQEYARIYKTLEQYAKQDMDPGQYEIFLHLNFWSDNRITEAQKRTESERTMVEINRFKADYADVVVRTMSTTYDGEKPSIGQIRADLWNTIAIDMAARGRIKNILIISNDADTTRIHSGYLTGMSAEFESTGADMITTGLRWELAPGLPRDSIVNRVLRYQMFLDDIRDRYSGVVRTSDLNTGISLATYLAAGGINRATRIGEVKSLAQRIRDLRSDGQGPSHYLSRVESRCYGPSLTSDSRRLIAAMALGRMPYDAWDETILPFGNDDSLRTDAARSTEAENQAKLHASEWVQQMSDKYITVIPLEKRARIQQAALTILGLSLE